MKNKMNIKSICIVLLLFLNLFRPYSISYNDYMNINIYLSLFLILISKPTLKTIKENIVIVIFSVIIFLSTYLYKTNDLNLWNGIRYGLQFLSLFFVTGRLIKKDGINDTIKSFYYISLLITLLMDMSVFTGVKLSHYENLDNYLFGNKFVFSYLHLLTCALMGINGNLNRDNNKSYRYILFCIYSIIMCASVNCLTGVVGIIVFSLMHLLPLKDNIKETLAKPKTIFIALYIFELLFLFSKVIYDIPFVKNIVKNVLNKGITLGGRYIIYAALPSVISKRFLLGYGYNTSIIQKVVGWGNAQNGVLQCLLDFGIIGTIIFFVNWYKCIKVKYDKNNWPLYCAIYAFIICSMFEVCFKFYFFIILCLLYNIGLSQKEENCN